MCFKSLKVVVIAYNLEQNICRLFHVLAQFLFATSETEPDYYHQKENVSGVASGVAERLKTLRKLGNFKKIPEMLRFDGQYSADNPKGKF